MEPENDGLVPAVNRTGLIAAKAFVRETQNGVLNFSPDHKDGYFWGGYICAGGLAITAYENHGGFPE